MSPTVLSTAIPATVHRLRLVPVADGMWRAIAATGRVVGHLRASGEGAQRRYLALRFHPVERRFRELGAFWSVEEAVDCLRLSR